MKTEAIEKPVSYETGTERILLVDDEEKAMAMGANGFLLKPIVISDMARMVRNVLEEGKT